MTMLRKCKAEVNIKMIRSEKELAQMFKEYAVGKGFINGEYDRQFTSFKKNNKSYCIKKTLNCYFHQFGTDTIEDDNGFHEYSVAIVEVADGEFAGRIEMVAPDKVKFVNKF